MFSSSIPASVCASGLKKVVVVSRQCLNCSTLLATPSRAIFACMEFTPMTRFDLQTIEAAADAYAAIHGVTMELDIQENDAPPSGNHPVQQVTLQVIRPMPGRRPRRYSRYFIIRSEALIYWLI